MLIPAAVRSMIAALTATVGIRFRCHAAIGLMVGGGGVNTSAATAAKLGHVSTTFSLIMPESSHAKYVVAIDAVASGGAAMIYETIS